MVKQVRFVSMAYLTSFEVVLEISIEKLKRFFNFKIDYSWLNLIILGNLGPFRRLVNSWDIMHSRL